MKRSMLQAYVSNAKEAIALYQSAFGATVLEVVPAPEGDKVLHSELDLFGQIFAVADRIPEAGREDSTGNIMQFCLHFAPEEEHLVRKAREVLKQEGRELVPLGRNVYCGLMTDIVDKFGVRWCLFAI